MKTNVIKSLILAIILSWGVIPAWAGTSLLKSSEWPFTDPTLFLKGGVNALTAGDSLVFWAMGDTVSVIDKDSFSEISTFRVSTSTAIQDMLYDEDTARLYIAAGYDQKEQSGGVQIFDLTTPANPVLTVVFDQAPDNPGSYLLGNDDQELVRTPMPHIDARGLGLYNGILFVADDNFGLRVIDVTTDPANPVEVPLGTPSSEEPTPERISGYKQPNITGSFDATGGYVNLIVYPFGGKVYAFVLDFYYGIKVFDVTVPSVIEDPAIKDTRTNIMYGSVSLLSDIFVTETGGRLTAYVTGPNANSSLTVISRMDVSVVDGTLKMTNFGRYESADESRSVSVRGNYAYIACGSTGLKIVDISSVPTPGIVLEYTLAGSFTEDVDFSYNVLADGNTLYLASGERGLSTLTLTDPLVPQLTTSLDAPLKIDDVCVQDSYSYILDRSKGLRIFENPDPSYPLLRGYLETAGTSTDLALSGQYAYIANTAGTITVVNISNPDLPSAVATHTLTADITRLAISGDTLYCADANNGLHRVDISDPTTPADIDSTATSAPALSVYVYENRAYVAEGPGGIEIFDLSGPAGPALLAAAPMTDARDITILDQSPLLFALVADGASGLKILDVTDLSAPLTGPVVVDTMDTGADTPSPFTAVSVSALGNTAFLGLGADGVLALDLSDPEVPVQLGYRDSPSEAGDIAPQLVDDTIYISVAERYAGLQTLYLSDSSVIDGDTADLVPTIDSGCFISTSFNQDDRTGWGRTLFSRVLSLLPCNTMTGETL